MDSPDLFLGIGLTLLITPRRWRPFWPAFCAPTGLALQSLVVWIGTHTLLPGTDSYATATLLIPVGLLGAACLRLRGGGRMGRVLFAARRWWAVALLMILSMSVQVYPFTRPPARLTSASLGNCDAADYAAGARVFKEFSSHDRSGFLGDNEIAKTLSVNNFFDFWLRINHFSPSAVIALNASLCGRQPYELTTLFGVVLLALHLPGVYWLARSAFRFGQAGSLAVTAIYGVNPIVYYAVYQTALGQLMAAPAVALLTWAGWQAYRAARTRRLAGWTGLLLVGDWLLFGSYNFFILFAYIPLLAYVGIRSLFYRNWRGTWRWTALIVLNVLVCAVLFPDRVMSIVERFKLFNKTHFGWPIPGFWPSGWYGAFADTRLTPTGAAWAVALATIGLSASAVAAWWQARRGRGHAGLLAACCTLPILFGYWILLRADRLHHDNSSYDAFKLFAVFYPGILISLCLWLRGPFTSWAARIGVAGLWIALLTTNLVGAWRYNAAVRNTMFFVDTDLAGVAAIERMPNVDSVNINMAQVWDRLWANSFLLHKPQYFSAATYEGRAVTGWRGQWDLSRRLASARIGMESDPLKSNATYSLIERRDERFIEVQLAQDWYGIEHSRKGTWCWGKATPTIRINNPHHDALGANVSFSVHSLADRHLRLAANGRTLWEGTTQLSMRAVDGVPLELPAGDTMVRFETPEAPDRMPDDPRGMTFLLSRFQVDVPGPGVASAPAVPTGTVELAPR